MRLSDIPKKFNLIILEDCEFKSLGTIQHNYPEQLTFINDIKYIDALNLKTNISAVITSEILIDRIPESKIKIISKNPKADFYRLHNYLSHETNFYNGKFKSEVSSSSIIHPTAFIADDCVKIGENCHIGPNVTVLEGTILCDNIIIRPGCVIGTEGFEFKKIDNQIIPVKHAGGVLINDNVEIQANCCISKAIFNGYTEIGSDTKLDNLVHVAHNVKIGERCLIAACAMIAGSVTIGDNVWIGPSVSISSGINIGDNAYLTIGSVITRDVNPDEHVSGNFAIDHEKFIKFIKTIRE